MRLNLRNELAYVLGLSFILLGIIVFGGPKPLRTVLGLPFVLFFPGYALIAALFPGKKDLDGIERVALSFGLSIAVVPLIGLLLNYTPWGIRLYPIALSLFCFILVMSCIATCRRRRLPEEERFQLSFEVELPRWSQLSRLDRVLTAALVASIVFAVGSLIYVISTPKVGERFTEFYILGLSGKAEGYPRDLMVGEEGKVILGVVNHEYAEVEYAAEIRVGGVTQKRIYPIRLGHEEKLERVVSFVPYAPGENIKVEFFLEKLSESPQPGVPYRPRRPSEEGNPAPGEPYRSLHLWINVRPSSGPTPEE